MKACVVGDVGGVVDGLALEIGGVVEVEIDALAGTDAQEIVVVRGEVAQLGQIVLLTFVDVVPLGHDERRVLHKRFRQGEEAVGRKADAGRRSLQNKVFRTIDGLLGDRDNLVHNKGEVVVELCVADEYWHVNAHGTPHLVSRVSSGGRAGAEMRREQRRDVLPDAALDGVVDVGDEETAQSRPAGDERGHHLVRMLERIAHAALQTVRIAIVDAAPRNHHGCLTLVDNGEVERNVRHVPRGTDDVVGIAVAVVLAPVEVGEGLGLDALTESYVPVARHVVQTYRIAYHILLLAFRLLSGYRYLLPCRRGKGKGCHYNNKVHVSFHDAAGFGRDKVSESCTINHAFSYFLL